ncbi:MAG: hypothetical protein EZS28_049982 [Streblomastix strix]|uniref:Uncharacterized protein n=1 Tax=Streblomastix strix TaxID=222440 RepID=A0A5J4T9Y0_9EUKA|nr:MAG: hypothetical protein EZS28_049982 [Streblomastix strix]
MKDQDAKSTTSSTVQNDSMPYTRFDLFFFFCLPYKQMGIKYSNAVSHQTQQLLASEAFIKHQVTFGAILAALLMNDRKMPTLIYKASSLLGIICVSPLNGLFIVYLSKPLVCIIPAAKKSINITYCGMKNISLFSADVRLAFWHLVEYILAGFFLRAKVWRKKQQYGVNIKKVQRNEIIIQ